MSECTKCQKNREDVKSIIAGLKEVLTLLSTGEGAPADGVSPSHVAGQGEDSLKQIVFGQEVPEDEALFRAVIKLITDAGYASTMVLQHKLEIDYRQAVNLIAELERAELIGPAHGFRPHKVLPGAFALRVRMEESQDVLDWQGSERESYHQQAHR
jgi:DNA segregation ATPase FtsK/SpoIIIE-like protein